nr:retrotransposon protein [Tanacetum cinerariifolium]
MCLEASASFYTKDYLTTFEPKSYAGVFLGYYQNSKAYIIINKHTRKVEESFKVTFDETPPPSKTSPLVDDDLDEEEAIKQLSVRHSVDHSSSRHSSSDHSSLDLPSTSAGPSRKRRRSPMTSVPALPLVYGALSPICADWIPPPKRVKDIGYLTDVEVDPRETRVERVTHPAMQEDIPEPAQEGAAEVTYETLGDLVQRKMPNTRSRASMTHEEVEALIAHRVAKEMKAREVARNLEALNENEEEQEEEMEMEEMRMEEAEEIEMGKIGIMA